MRHVERAPADPHPEASRSLQEGVHGGPECGFRCLRRPCARAVRRPGTSSELHPAECAEARIHPALLGFPKATLAHLINASHPAQGRDGNAKDSARKALAISSASGAAAAAEWLSAVCRWVLSAAEPAASIAPPASPSLEAVLQLELTRPGDSNGSRRLGPSSLACRSHSAAAHVESIVADVHYAKRITCESSGSSTPI